MMPKRRGRDLKSSLISPHSSSPSSSSSSSSLPLVSTKGNSNKDGNKGINKALIPLIFVLLLVGVFIAPLVTSYITNRANIGHIWGNNDDNNNNNKQSDKNNNPHTANSIQTNINKSPSTHSTTKLSIAITITSCPDNAEQIWPQHGLSDGTAVLRHSVITNMKDWDGTLDFVAIIHESAKGSTCEDAVR
jgi:hypothetical protein